MGSRFRLFPALLIALAVAALAGCQTAPQTTSQTGADNALRGGVSPVSPVDQTGTSERAIIVEPTIVLPGAVATADGKPGTLPSITISIGAKADGDLVTSGRQETSTKDEKSAGSTSTPSQTNGPAAIAAAAGELLKPAVPGSEAATLATAALEAAKAGDGKTAAARLDAAKSAAAKAAPASGGDTP